MQQFEYKVIDLNSLARGQTLLDVLNAAGTSGWELVSISHTNSGIFKRRVGDDRDEGARAEAVAAPAPAPRVSATGDDREKLRQEMEEVAREAGLSLGDILDSDLMKIPAPGTVKFQDPAHPENTWSGRGRMPKWLAKAIAEGNSKEAYRVRSTSED